MKCPTQSFDVLYLYIGIDIGYPSRSVLCKTNYTNIYKNMK